MCCKGLYPTLFSGSWNVYSLWTYSCSYILRPEWKKSKPFSLRRTSLLMKEEWDLKLFIYLNVRKNVRTTLHFIFHGSDQYLASLCQPPSPPPPTYVQKWLGYTCSWRGCLYLSKEVSLFEHFSFQTWENGVELVQWSCLFSSVRGPESIEPAYSPFFIALNQLLSSLDALSLWLEQTFYIYFLRCIFLIISH